MESGPVSSGRWAIALRLLIGGAGLWFGLFAFFGGRPDFREGKNDFVVFYVAAGAAGSDRLYDADLYDEFERNRFGGRNESALPVRLPLYYAALKPLSWFAYRDAHLIWIALQLLALAVFLAAVEVVLRAEAAMFLAVSFPIMSSFANGHDSALMLAILGVSLWLERTGRGVLAGAALSLLSMKFHLFLTLPLLIIGRKRLDVGKGFAIGAGLQVLSSFWIAGVDWPLQYYEIVSQPIVSPRPGIMPNLHGLLSSLPGATSIELLLAAAIAIITMKLSRLGTFSEAFALVLTGGLLISYHSYLPDATLVLPAILLLGSRTAGSWIHLAGVFVLLPPVWIGLLLGSPFSLVAQVSILLVFSLAALDLWRRPKVPTAAV